MSGDPFRFRLPKFIRKFQPGKALGRLGSLVARNIGTLASFVPVMGPVLGKAFDRAMKLAENIPGGQDSLTAFARSYGYDVNAGDPRESWPGFMGDPAGRPPKAGMKRKQAAAGPAVKAKRKAGARAAKSGGGTAASDDRAAAMLAALKGGNVIGAAAGEGAALFKSLTGHGGKAAAGFGGHRRSMNPANVHALRRSMRRVEGFEKLARRVMPHVFTRGRIASGHRTRHKPGCSCAVCKRS